MRKSIATIALAAVAATGVACGSDSESSKADAAGDSAYCQTARKWAVHELDPRDDQNPAWMKPYWSKYLAFTQDASATAPAEIKDDWKVYLALVARQTAVLEKYGYDNVRGEREATDEEQTAFQPDEKTQRAFESVLRYEALTCDAGQPLAADVDFSDLKPGKYCDLLATDNERFGAVRESGMQPDDVKRVMLDPANEDINDELKAAAPSALENDVAAVIDWQQDHQVPTAQRYGFDIRKVLLEGSQQERRDVQSTDPSVAGHYARVAAYEQQVCGS